MADEILRNFAPYECVDTNLMGEAGVGVCILNSLVPLKVSLT